MIHSPVSPESPHDRDAKRPARAFARIHNYESGLEVAAHQHREKSDLDPVLVLDPPETSLHDVHGRWREAPQVIDTTAPQAMGDAALEPRTPSVGGSATVTSREREREGGGEVVEKGEEEEEEEERRGRKRRMVCGVGVKVFVVIAVLVVLLVAAIVGGAVGGVLARKSGRSAASNLTPFLTPTTTTTTPSPSETDSSSPSPATQSPHVHFRFQTYEEQNMQGSTQLFVEPGLYRPGFPIKSYVWITAKDGDLLDPTPLLRCSVGFCKNSKLLGWRGASNMRQAGTSASYDASANFIIIVCDLVYPEPDCRGKGLDEGDATRTVATVGIVETQGAENPEQEFTDVLTSSGSGSGNGTVGATAQVTGGSGTRAGSRVEVTERESSTRSRPSTATKTQSD